MIDLAVNLGTQARTMVKLIWRDMKEVMESSGDRDDWKEIR